MRRHGNQLGHFHFPLLSPSGESFLRSAHENTAHAIWEDPPANAANRPTNRHTSGTALALAAILLLAGCGRGGAGKLPSACRFPGGASSVRAALARAPGQVRIGGTPLSKCLVREADPADVQSVGATYVEVATDLAADARRSPHGPAATQLGYLEGAVKSGASKTAGVHYELERRVQQELDGVDTRAPEYVRGERAGENDG